jgi:hypothetical protein
MEVYILLALTLVIGVLLIFGGGASSKLKNSIEKQLTRVDELLRGSASEKKEALILLDSLLDKSLKMKGFRGESLGERLKASQKFFTWDIYTNTWEAHKVRNKIVHDGYNPSGAELKKSVKYLRSAINNLLK